MTISIFHFNVNTWSVLVSWPWDWDWESSYWEHSDRSSASASHILITNYLKLFNTCICFAINQIIRINKLTLHYHFFLSLFRFDLLWNTGDLSQYPVYVASGYLSLTLFTTQLGKLEREKIIINMRLKCECQYILNSKQSSEFHTLLFRLN